MKYAHYKEQILQDPTHSNPVQKQKVGWGQRLGRRLQGLCLRGNTVVVWGDEKVLGMDSSDGCTAM